MKLRVFHIVCIALTVGSAAIALLVFPNALGRLIESCRDIGLSVARFFVALSGQPDLVHATVTDLPDYTFLAYLGSAHAPDVAIASTFEGFAAQWTGYWQRIVSPDNLIGYFASFPATLRVLMVVVVIALPVLLLFTLLMRNTVRSENTDHGHESRPLRLFKRFADKVYYPSKRCVADFARFVAAHKCYWLPWAIIWAYAFNLITIAFEFIAYYFFIASGFDLTTLYTQIFKLALDLYAPITFIPAWLWVILGVVIFDRLRRKIGYMRLNGLESRDRRFINDRPLVTMLCGTMGKGKTTAITDMALSRSVMFRDKAFELILENDMRFPYFPWIVFEDDLKAEIRAHRVYNLATCVRFVRHRRRLFERAGQIYKLLADDKAASKSWRRHCKKAYNAAQPDLCWGYDHERYGMTYNDELKVCRLWDVLESYARLYFIYIVQSSLLIANYSVRTDDLMSDLGNFPLWDSDFFKRDSRLIDSFSRHAHILDFDMLRLGRKILEDNPNKDALEFGVIVCTEIGKERQNSKELQEIKKKTEETNQKNDLFNYSLKMIRHRATVDNYCFICFLTDEQRPESWGADARDLAEVVHIRDQSESRLVLPFFFLEELLHDLIFKRFTDYYTEYRYRRGDSTLLLHLLKTFSAKFHSYHERTYNIFGVRTQTVRVENGTLDGEYAERKYYLMSKKIYSKRFSTDCYSEYFMEKALRSARGINDMREYLTERARATELNYQNSYFVADMINMELQDTAK